MFLQRDTALEDGVGVCGLARGGGDVLWWLAWVGLVLLQDGGWQGRRERDVGVWEGNAVGKREEGGDGQRHLRQ